MRIKPPTTHFWFSLTIVHSKVGADIVELCPENDVHSATAMVGGKIAVRRNFQFGQCYIVFYSCQTNPLHVTA